MKSPASTFTVNIISNFSTETFLNNTLATFSNLLPGVIDLNKLKGLWQVALLEISWPPNVKNVTSGFVEINCAQNEETETDEEEEDEEEAANAGELEAPIEPTINKEVFVPISRRKQKPIWTRVDKEEPPPKKMAFPNEFINLQIKSWKRYAKESTIPENNRHGLSSGQSLDVANCYVYDQQQQRGIESTKKIRMRMPAS